MRRFKVGQRGISLIEALVALAVMGFGTLAVLGAQTTLRQNSDISRQRSEAVRIAQETIERARAYSDITVWRDTLVNSGPTAVTGLANVNTTFTVQTRVVADSGENAAPQKTMSVVVAWTDRAGQAQTVQLQSVIQGVPPSLSGSLSLPRNAGPVRMPQGRHFAIPPEAVAQSDGTSRFTPPATGDGGVVQWVFDNLTGDITRICTGADTTALTCMPVTARLFSGFIRFATSVDQPGPVHAETPPGNLIAAGMRVMSGTGTDATELASCAVRDSLAARAFFCAVPASVASGWTGTAQVIGLGALATSRQDADANKLRVCRYTPYRDRHPTVGAPPDGIRNDETPLVYIGVRSALTNQNFLVIKAGHNGSPNDCPAHNGSPLFNSNTWHHQPSA